MSACQMLLPKGSQAGRKDTARCCTEPETKPVLPRDFLFYFTFVYQKLRDIVCDFLLTMSPEELKRWLVLEQCGNYWLSHRKAAESSRGPAAASSCLSFCAAFHRTEAREDENTRAMESSPSSSERVFTAGDSADYSIYSSTELSNSSGQC